MKVLHVTTHMNIGGIAQYITDLSRWMKYVTRDDITVCSSGGAMVPILTRSGVKHMVIDIDTKSELSPKIIGAAFALKKIIREEEIEIIHAHSRVSQVAARLASHMTGVPYVTTAHGFFKKRLRGILDTWGERVIAVSDAVKKHLTDDLGVRDERVSVIYSGIDLKAFDGSCLDNSTLAEAIAALEGPVVGTIGRLSPVKGQKFLIQAVKILSKKYPDIKCFIVGEGPDSQRLKNYTISANLDGNLFFYRSDPQTAKYLRRIDVFVMPSLNEGLGLSLLAAFASKKACVVTNVGGLRDLVRDGWNGILVEPGNVDQLALAIERLITDNELRARLATNGYETVSTRFTLDRMGREVRAFYENVIKEHSR